MDNKEAIIRIKNKRDRIFAKLGRVAIVDALDLAIKSMEQMDVLDKIRAEIIENSIEDYKYHGCGTDELIIETSEVLKIIDKHKAESER